MVNQLTDIDYTALEYICLNLRDCDKREIYALRNYDNALQLAMDAHAAIRNFGRGRVSWVDGRPAAVAAFTEEWPGVWYVWMFGTKDFKAAAIPLLRWVRKEANAILSVCDGHRLHCDSIVGHHEAHKMIRAMGGLPEFTDKEGNPLPSRKLGKGGEDFIRFVWLKGENEAVLHPHYVRAG
jgi:hypothetical protein